MRQEVAENMQKIHEGRFIPLYYRQKGKRKRSLHALQVYFYKFNARSRGIRGNIWIRPNKYLECPKTFTRTRCNNSFGLTPQLKWRTRRECNISWNTSSYFLWFSCFLWDRVNDYFADFVLKGVQVFIYYLMGPLKCCAFVVFSNDLEEQMKYCQRHNGPGGSVLLTKYLPNRDTSRLILSFDKYWKL